MLVTTLAQSIGVIMGANIGTTVTAWMISLFGFGKFSISIISIPLLELGFHYLFIKSKRKSLGEFIFGFAFLFLGLDYLKDSMPDLQNNPGVLAFVSNFSDLGFLSTLIFLFIGNSHRYSSIFKCNCSHHSHYVFSRLIGFESAAAMIMGKILAQQ